MIEKQQITDLVNDKLKGTDQFLVSVMVDHGNKISITIDSDSSVKIDDCIQISRHVESGLNRDMEDFELNVSSAGLDQPLKLMRQYRKYLNKEISVLTNEGRKIKGLLNSIQKEYIELLIPANKKKKTIEQKMEIRFNDIKETKGIISFKK